MKRYSYLLLAALLGMLTFVSCSDNDDDCTEVSGLKVVKTTLDMTYQGGTGIIELNQSNLMAEASAEWIKTSCEGDKVNLTIERNNGYEARTAIVTVRPNGGTEEQKVPITQLGIISIIGVENYSFDYHGETAEFMWNTTDEFSIDNLPDWLTYRVSDGKIYFKAKALPMTGSSRSAVVRIKVGQLIDKQVQFEQPLPVLPYEAIAGTYTMTYTRWHGNSAKEKSVALVANGDGRTFTLTGLDFPIIAVYDSSLPGIRINAQPLNIPNAGDSYTLMAWTAYGSGFFSPISDFGLMGICKDKNNIKFTMVNNEADNSQWLDNDNKPNIVYGFIVWGKNTKELKSSYSRLVDITLTKVVE